jgi:hypothetical protein
VYAIMWWNVNRPGHRGGGRSRLRTICSEERCEKVKKECIVLLVQVGLSFGLCS